MDRIYDVRCNLEENPLCIEKKELFFSFKVKCDGASVDTGKVKVEIFDAEQGNRVARAERTGGGICGISCNLADGKPFTRYEYEIAVWDQDGREIGTSGRKWFETGFVGIEKPDTFIYADYEKEKTAEAPAFLMRRDFSLPDAPVSAKAFVTAKGLYEFHLNGEKAGDDHLTPGFTDYHVRLQYQAYDVTDMLRKGENTAGFILGDGWYKGYINWNEKRNWYGDRRAAWMYLRIELANGDIVTFTTDDDFSWTLSPIEFSEIYQGECYDARKEYDGWDTPNFDAKDIFQPVIVEKEDVKKLIPEENTAVRTVREIPAQQLFVTPKGEVMVDFGQDIVGNVRIAVSGRTGERVRIRHGEWIDDDGNFYYENIAPSRQQVEYTLKGRGIETYTARFTYQNFRYIQILEFPGEPQLSNFTAEVWSSFDNETGFFQCSNPDVNRLYENTKWSQRGNFIDIPIAGPQRTERLGWTGDGQIFAKTACFHMDARRFYRKWLGDLKADQFPDGAVPWVVPNVLGEEEYTCLDFFTPCQKDPTSAAWGDAALIIPWELYLQYGDTDILETQYDSMKAYVEYMRKSAGGDYVFYEGFHYGDWFALDASEGSFVGATPKELIASAYYAHSTDILAKTAALLGREEDRQRGWNTVLPDTDCMCTCAGIRTVGKRDGEKSG